MMSMYKVHNPPPPPTFCQLLLLFLSSIFNLLSGKWNGTDDGGKDRE